MIIVNQTRQTIITNEVVIPTSLLSQSLGLLKHNSPVAMLLRTHFGVHTFWMKYSIDVMILTKTNHVVVMKANLKPNNIFLWNPKHETVLELPSGTIKKSKTKIGDKVEMK